ncbi:protein tyrosine phosphatase family protein [Altererythrobacter sp. CC-YST694]|uniref:protein tyrosine phosphatase family protein n=1 Tax=Altererythrobacter sp. CC-YST694 TaxID=2755038 RepID=UPI001D03486D|nr:protein tyrosine phosphatase family protein [Altererythrobacter sp. CC-YST694]MCB5425689.1 protein tyrosine phosphatase family protein [Altererythrobacter sp. CC-YST694]
MGDPEDIRGWQRLSSRVTTSGRIEDADIARLKAIGIAHVINLALDDHPDALADEGAKLASAGIGYTHIPVPFDAPGEDHFHAFVDALGAIDAPIHVHCIANWRVSAFFYRYHLARGMAKAEARALMERQWSPLTSDHPAAPAWAAFIGESEA